MLDERDQTELSALTDHRPAQGKGIERPNETVVNFVLKHYRRRYEHAASHLCLERSFRKASQLFSSRGKYDRAPRIIVQLPPGDPETDD
jgi:hypothetical protein